MKSVEVKYGLRCKKTGKILTYDMESNAGGSNCCGIMFRLSEDTDSPTWLLDDPEEVDWVRRHSTEWYNAGYETPKHKFEPGELEVVKVATTTEIEKFNQNLPNDIELSEVYCSSVVKNSEQLEYLKSLAGKIGPNPINDPYWYKTRLEACRKAGFFQSAEEVKNG